MPNIGEDSPAAATGSPVKVISGLGVPLPAQPIGVFTSNETSPHGAQAFQLPVITSPCLIPTVQGPRIRTNPRPSRSSRDNQAPGSVKVINRDPQSLYLTSELRLSSTSTHRLWVTPSTRPHRLPPPNPERKRRETQNGTTCEASH